MRQSLIDLVNNTIIYQYDLPNNGAGILKTIFSTENDVCYKASDIEGIAEIIYNSIVDYAFNEFDLEAKDLDTMHAVALRNKLKYNPDADDDAKIKYGFFGETILYSILMVLYQANPIIARGYFYNPLESAETKGYDSYQLVENNEKVELWFGEVKFHINHSSCINSVLKNIDKALSDQYLENNILALHNHKNNLNLEGSVIEHILQSWELNPSINIAAEIAKYSMKLVYPILLLYEEDVAGFDASIKKIPEYIFQNYQPKTFSLTVDHQVFFILLPLNSVKQIKQTVIQWIESKKRLIL